MISKADREEMAHLHDTTTDVVERILNNQTTEQDLVWMLKHSEYVQILVYLFLILPNNLCHL